MTLLVRGALLLALALPVLGAVPLHFGEPFPLTNTRYDVSPGIPALASNGTDLLLVWSGDQSVRAARLADGQHPTGQFVLPTYGSTDDVAVVWTGSHYLVAATSRDNGLPVVAGRLLDANGTPAGEPFTIVFSATTPRLATNGSRVVLLYRSEPTGDVFARTLDLDGQPLQGRAAQMVAPRAAFGPSYAIASNGNGFMAIASGSVEILLIRFNSDGFVQSTRTLTGSQGSTRPRPATIASNGSGYFAAWFDFSRRGLATTIDENGESLSPVVFDEIVSSPTPTFVAPSAVWSGSDWVLSYTRRELLDLRMRVVRLDAAARTVTRREPETQVDLIATTSVARLGNTVRVAWNASRPPFDRGIVVATLPLSFGAGSFVTNDASDQRLLAAAGTPSLSIFLWNESADRDTTTWLGVGDLGGSWLERPLAIVSETAMASAGDGFLVVAREGNSSVAIVLDTNGTPVGSPKDLDIAATSIAWNGSVWAVAGERNDGVSVVEVTSGGSIGAPKQVRTAANTPAIASDGDEFLVVWRAIGTCAPPCSEPMVIRGARLSSNLDRLDGSDLNLAPSTDVEYPSVAWSAAAENYVVAWTNAEEVHTKSMPSDGPVGSDSNMIHAGVVRQTDLSIAAVSDAIGLTWRDGEVTRVAFLNLASNISRSFVFPDLDRPVAGAPKLVELAEGDIGLLFTQLREEEPHHGAMRVMIAVSSLAPTGAPETPSIAAQRLSDGRIAVSWTTPDRTVNGFRVEYRIGDGPWLEVEEWFDRTLRSLTFTPPPGNAPVSFRVRSYIDDGPSLYSNIATVTVAPPVNPRRRAVRK